MYRSLKGRDVGMSRHITVVGNDTRFRNFALQTIESNGYSGVGVSSLNEEHFTSRLSSDTALIIIVCESVNDSERAFIRYIRNLPTPVPFIVLVEGLSVETMRELFLMGAVDVTDKPNLDDFSSDGFARMHFIAIITEAFDSKRYGK
jgi:DNA-binding NtrC family response regulator